MDSYWKIIMQDCNLRTQYLVSVHPLKWSLNPMDSRRLNDHEVSWACRWLIGLDYSFSVIHFGCV